jgi:hypothetical protein
MKAEFRKSMSEPTPKSENPMRDAVRTSPTSPAFGIASAFELRSSNFGRLLVALLILVGLVPGPAFAHSGSENVFYEGNIGPYAARVIIQRPDVVPGLADITIRVLQGEPTQVAVLPLKWNLGKKGAPTPDIAQPVRGEKQLYSAQLWFMENGSQSVEVTFKGAAGEASVQIPVAVMPTKVETMPPGLGTILLLLGVVLVLILLGIVRGAVRESVLAAGEAVSRKRAWVARGAVLFACVVLVLGLRFGKRWWDAEEQAYLTGRLYQPLAGAITASVEGGRRLLRLELPEGDLLKRSPIVPDHGKLMHLVLVSDPDQRVLAHLHPLKLNRRTFVVVLPEIPAGEYVAYAEVTYETGFAENITGSVQVPALTAGPPTAGGLKVGFDPDDAWHVAAPDQVGDVREGRRLAGLGDGHTLEWLDSKVVTAGEDISMRFQVRDAAGQPVPTAPYMGVLGHLFLRSADGHLFTHLHPAGSFSMASQQLIELRAQGKAPNEVNFGALEPVCELPSVEDSLAYWNAQKSAGADHSFSFPWKFVDPGDYRIWVQVKVDGRIRTGAFDVTVRPPSS